jgi:hypothetical protein
MSEKKKEKRKKKEKGWSRTKCRVTHQLSTSSILPGFVKVHFKRIKPVCPCEERPQVVVVVVEVEDIEVEVVVKVVVAVVEVEVEVVEGKEAV